LIDVIDWMFRNRRTGGLTVVQFPNLSLFVFLVATVVRLIASPRGRFRTAVDVVAALALFCWAADEVIRGVNPFRRILGAATLGSMLVNFLS
jgi:hypothetical protein